MDDAIHVRLPELLKNRLYRTAHERMTHEGVIVRQALLEHFGMVK